MKALNGGGGSPAKRGRPTPPSPTRDDGSHGVAYYGTERDVCRVSASQALLYYLLAAPFVFAALAAAWVLLVLAWPS